MPADGKEPPTELGETLLLTKSLNFLAGGSGSLPVARSGNMRDFR
jgi:hypothetical protein